jgi:hypothetical protein
LGRYPRNVNDENSWAHRLENNMKARQVFVALMTGKGYTEDELQWDGKKFTNSAITTRWNYFLQGWEMRGVM